jgi:ATP-dependent RNA helicase DeaD
MTRFFVNLGRKDQLNPGKLIGLINDQNITDNVEIGQIEILDTFSFFELDKNFTDETIAAFVDTTFNGRSVNVEVTEKKKRSGGGGRRRGGEERRGRGRRFEGKGRGDRRSNDSGGRSDRNESRRRDGGNDRSDRRDRPDRSDRTSRSADKPDRSAGFGRRRN